MPGTKAIPYTWRYTDGGADVTATDSREARLIRDEKDAAVLLRVIVKRFGLDATAKLLAEVAAEDTEPTDAKKGGSE